MTTKLGSSDKRPGTGAAPDIRSCKLYAGEAAMSMFVLSAAIYGIVTVNRWTFSVFLMLQGAPPAPQTRGLPPTPTNTILAPELLFVLLLVSNRMHCS